MIELRPHFPLCGLLRTAGLPRSSLYDQQRALKTIDKHCDLKNTIREIFDRHRGRYGYRRVTAELKRTGWTGNHKTVQKLMIAMQLKSLVLPKRYRAFAGAVCETAPNHLQRDFKADQPNQKWVTDVTEFKVNNRKLYLSPVMDLYNREIVSYEVAERPLPSMIERMHTKAFGRLGSSEKPMLHSDQGWQGVFNRSSQHRVAERILGTRSRSQPVSSSPAFYAACCSRSGPRLESHARSSEIGQCLLGSIGAGARLCSRSCRAVMGCEGQQRRP